MASHHQMHLRPHTNQKQLRIPLEPSLWTPRHLALLNIRLEYDSHFNHVLDSVPSDWSGIDLDIRQLDAIKLLDLTVAGDINPYVNQGLEFWALFRASYLLVSEKRQQGLLHEMAIAYAGGIITYLSSRVFACDNPVEIEM